MTKNFDYLRPLSIAADEEMANAMAEAIYGASPKSSAFSMKLRAATMPCARTSSPCGICSGCTTKTAPTRKLMRHSAPSMWRSMH